MVENLALITLPKFLPLYPIALFSLQNSASWISVVIDLDDFCIKEHQLLCWVNGSASFLSLHCHLYIQYVDNNNNNSL